MCLIRLVVIKVSLGTLLEKEITLVKEKHSVPPFRQFKDIFQAIIYRCTVEVAHP